MTSQETIKAAVRERDGYRCVECGMTADEHYTKYGRNLEVHRIIPRSKYNLDGCVTLCRQCHALKAKTPRRNSGPDESRNGRAPLNMWLPDEMHAALMECVARSERSITTEVTIALRKHLQEAGL